MNTRHVPLLLAGLTLLSCDNLDDRADGRAMIRSKTPPPPVAAPLPTATPPPVAPPTPTEPVKPLAAPAPQTLEPSPSAPNYSPITRRHGAATQVQPKPTPAPIAAPEAPARPIVQEQPKPTPAPAAAPEAPARPIVHEQPKPAAQHHPAAQVQPKPTPRVQAPAPAAAQPAVRRSDDIIMPGQNRGGRRRAR